MFATDVSAEIVGGIPRDLNVRWFTAATIDLFPLKLADVGRCITDLHQRFDDRNFIVAMREVMHTGTPDEAEVRNLEGRCYLRRIRPYLWDDEPVGGVAITFTDITERMEAESEIRRTEAAVRAQKEAFQAALNGQSLEDSLDFLVSAAVEQLGDGARCAIYLADSAGFELHHIAAMPDHYAVCADGFGCWARAALSETARNASELQFFKVTPQWIRGSVAVWSRVHPGGRKYA